MNILTKVSLTVVLTLGAAQYAFAKHSIPPQLGANMLTAPLTVSVKDLKSGSSSVAHETNNLGPNIVSEGKRPKWLLLLGALIVLFGGFTLVRRKTP